MNILTDNSDSEENYTYYQAVEETERVRLTDKILREQAQTHAKHIEAKRAAEAVRRKQTEQKVEMLKQKLQGAGIQP